MNGTTVWLPDNVREGILRKFTSVKSPLQFFHTHRRHPAGLAGQPQTILPGYRERVVRVRLREGEGGLRLDMPRKFWPSCLTSVTRPVRC